MSEQQKKRNSLLKSSLNIKSISSSVTSFSQTLNESNVTARQISSTVRENNIFKRRKSDIEFDERYISKFNQKST